MLAERVVEWTEKWKQQGLEQGLLEGLEKGLKKGFQQGIAQGEITLLRRQLTRRFGPLPAWAKPVWRVPAQKSAKPGRTGCWKPCWDRPNESVCELIISRVQLIESAGLSAWRPSQRYFVLDEGRVSEHELLEADNSLADIIAVNRDTDVLADKVYTSDLFGSD